MQQIRDFSNMFDGIVLNILIAFLMFYIFCPPIITDSTVKAGDIPPEDLSLAGALAFFLIKYIHESATSSVRFEQLYAWAKLDACGFRWSMFTLFLAKLLVPLTVCLCIFACLWLPKNWTLFELLNLSEDVKVAGLLSVVIIYIFSFLFPDVVHKHLLKEYEQKTAQNPPKKGRKTDKQPQPNFELLSQTVRRWFIITGLITASCIIWAILCVASENMRQVKCSKFFISGVMVFQTILDYILNSAFYFEASE